MANRPSRLQKMDDASRGMCEEHQDTKSGVLIGSKDARVYHVLNSMFQVRGLE